MGEAVWAWSWWAGPRKPRPRSARPAHEKLFGHSSVRRRTGESAPGACCHSLLLSSGALGVGGRTRTGRGPGAKAEETPPGRALGRSDPGGVPSVLALLPASLRPPLPSPCLPGPCLPGPGSICGPGRGGEPHAGEGRWSSLGPNFLPPCGAPQSRGQGSRDLLFDTSHELFVRCVDLRSQFRAESGSLWMRQPANSGRGWGREGENLGRWRRRGRPGLTCPHHVCWILQRP